MRIRHIIMAFLVLVSPYLLAADGFSGGGSGCSSCSADKAVNVPDNTKSSDGGGSQAQKIDGDPVEVTKSIFDAMPDIQLLAWITSSTFLETPSKEFLEFAYFKASGATLSRSFEDSLDDIKDAINSASSILLGAELQIGVDMGTTKNGKIILVVNLKDGETGSKLFQLIGAKSTVAKSVVTIDDVEMTKITGFEICKPKPDDSVCEKPDILYGKVGNTLIFGHEEMVKPFIIALKDNASGRMKPLMKELANKWQLQTNASLGLIVDLSKTLTYEKTIETMDAFLAKDGIEPSMAFLAGAIANGSSGAGFEFATFLNSISEADFEGKMSLKNKNFDLSKLLPAIFPQKEEENSRTNGDDTQSRSDGESSSYPSIACYNTAYQLNIGEQLEVILEDENGISADTVTAYNIPNLMNFGITNISATKIKVIFGADMNMPVPVDQIVVIADNQSDFVHFAARIRVGLPFDPNLGPLDGKDLCAK